MKNINTKTIIAGVGIGVVLIGLFIYGMMPHENANGTVSPKGPLMISEATITNATSARLPNGEIEDWVELKNMSDEPVNLSDYCLSDSKSDISTKVLPSYTLNPGEYALLYCDSKDAKEAGLLTADFSMNADGETLYLQNASGIIIDTLEIPGDTPPDGSYGRMAVEANAGTYSNAYFVNPTPNADNANGWERVSAKVVDKTPAGVYDDVESVAVELSSPGTIYYTTNGTLPTTASAVYEGPITVTQTTVIRAFCVEEGALPSRVRSLTYLVNEHHELPVISVSVNDINAFNSMYNSGSKSREVAGSVSFYENGSLSWERACGVFMKGWTSLGLPKKSMGFEFGSEYGEGKLHYDVFDTGVSTYKSLSIHAGQDYQFAVIRSELCQNLVLQSDSKLYTQHGKYCAVYVNGEYRGLYCLKEDLSRSSFAYDHGVAKSSVSSVTAMNFNAVGTKGFDEDSADLGQSFYAFAFNNDMTDPANYEEYCKRVDIDVLIDYFLFMGWCSNSDTLNNMRYYKSSELGDKWQPTFYDLDWSFYYTADNYANLYNGVGNSSPHMEKLLHVLFKNSEFRMAVLTRFEELNRTILSNENVLAELDRLSAQVQSEVVRDHKKWGLSYNVYEQSLSRLRSWFTDKNWAQRNRENLTKLVGYSQAEWDEAIARVDAKS